MDSLSTLGFDVNKTQKVELIHPKTDKPILDNEGNPAYIEVYGPYSDAARAYEKLSMDKRYAKFERTRKISINSDTVQAQETGYLVAITKDWYLVDFEGNPIEAECNKKNKESIYSLPQYAWIKEQIDIAVGRASDFLQRPASTS